MFPHLLLQEVIKHRDAAQAAAIEAMQEASVAESLLRFLRYITLITKENQVVQALYCFGWCITCLCALSFGKYHMICVRLFH